MRYWKSVILMVSFLLNINSSVLATSQIILNNEKNTVVETETGNIKEMCEKLSSAILEGNTKEVKKLIATKIDLNNKDWPFLIMAVMMDRQDIVKLLIEAGANVNLPSSDGTSILSSAVIMGHTEVVRLLVSSGAKLKFNLDGEEESILTSLVLMLDNKPNKYTEMLEVLLLAGANPNEYFGEKRWTILMDAANRGNLSAVELLIKTGANVNAKTIDGVTPCSCAESEGYSELVKRLKNTGAKCKEFEKRTAYIDIDDPELPIVQLSKHVVGDVFNEGFKLESSTLFQIKQVIEGLNVDAQDNEGNTVLMSILSKPINEHYDNTSLTIGALIKAGADVNIKNKAGDTALLIASRNTEYSISVIGDLIKAGADTTAKDSNGRTPLINLIKAQHDCECFFFSFVNSYFADKAIEEMVRAGVDVNAQDNEGKTALSLNEEDGLTSLFTKTLLRLGAKPNTKTKSLK